MNKKVTITVEGEWQGQLLQTQKALMLTEIMNAPPYLIPELVQAMAMNLDRMTYVGVTQATLPEGAANAIREAMSSKINKAAPIRPVTGAMLPPYLQTVPADTVMIEKHDFTPHPGDHERCVICGLTAVEHGTAPAIPAAECQHRPGEWIPIEVRGGEDLSIPDYVRYCMVCKAYQYSGECEDSPDHNQEWHTPEEN